MVDTTRTKPGMPRAQKITLIVFILVFLLPASIGFMDKLYMFWRTQSSDDGAFALVPLANYLIVVLGMLCLLVAAIGRGMFRDMEAPKYTMLENERRLDEQEGVFWD